MITRLAATLSILSVLLVIAYSLDTLRPYTALAQIETPLTINSYLEMTPANGQPFLVKGKMSGLSYPVAVFTPKTAGQKIALDLIPGNGANGGGHGYAWIDVCDGRDNNSLNCARIAARTNDIQFGSRLFGPGTPKPLVFTVGADVEVLRISTDNRVGINTNTPATTLDVNGLIRAYQTSTAECSTSVAGAIYYNTSDRHFYGCNGVHWRQLD